MLHFLKIKNLFPAHQEFLVITTPLKGNNS